MRKVEPMASINGLIKKYQLISYFILTYFLTWIIFFLPFFITINDMATKILLMAIGGTGPAFAAMIISHILKPDRIRTDTKKYIAVLSIAGLITAALIVLYLHIQASASLFLLLLVLINAVIAAFIISGGLFPRKGIKELLSKLYIAKVNWKWYILALFLIPAFIIIIAMYCTLHAGISLKALIPQLTFGGVSSVIITCGYVTLVRGPLREEIGWRGFALPRLQYRYSPLIATLILGIIWTVWHLPLHLTGIYAGGIGGFIERFYYNVGITFLITWIYNHSKGSLLLTTFFHTSFNSTATVFIFPAGINGSSFMLIISILINIAAIIVIFTDRMWKKLPNESDTVYKY